MRRMLASIAAVLLIPIAAPSPASAAGCSATAPPRASDLYYELSEPGHIEWIRVNSSWWGLAYRMIANIDLASCAQWTSGIGVDGNNAFTGTFDGNGYAIENFNYSGSSSSGTIYSGLFGFLNGATVRDLTLQGSVTASTSGSTGYEVKGGLIAGSVEGLATLSNIDVQGTVDVPSASGNTFVGGVVGYCDEAQEASELQAVTTVSASVDSTRNLYAGGICGIQRLDFDLSSASSGGSVTALGARFRSAGGISGSGVGGVGEVTSTASVTSSGGSPWEVTPAACSENLRQERR